MQTQGTLGQDVLYTRSGEKGECPAKIVRIVDPQKNIVDLFLFTDDPKVVEKVPFNESGNLENSWHLSREQARAASGR